MARTRLIDSNVSVRFIEFSLTLVVHWNFARHTCVRATAWQINVRSGLDSENLMKDVARRRAGNSWSGRPTRNCGPCDGIIGHKHRASACLLRLCLGDHRRVLIGRQCRMVATVGRTTVGGKRRGHGTIRPHGTHAHWANRRPSTPQRSSRLNREQANYECGDGLQDPLHD